MEHCSVLILNGLWIQVPSSFSFFLPTNGRLCTRVQSGVTTIMADISREPSSPTLLSPKQVLVELVPRVLMALWPRSKIHTYLALSDMAVGMAAAILKRISSSAKEAGDVLIQVGYSQDRCSETVDAILGKTSGMFLPELWAEALDARCLKLITLLTDVMGAHVLVMFGMAADTSEETAQSSEEISAAKDTEVSDLVTGSMNGASAIKTVNISTQTLNFNCGISFIHKCHTACVLH